MSVLLILILASLGLATFFLGAFIWAVKSSQFEDTCTPSLRVLTDDSEKTHAASTLSTPATKSKTQ